MSPQLFNVFLESQIASHTAAAALLFSQLLSIGCPCEVQPDMLVSSAVSLLTDLTQIMVKCPFKNGILDGLIMLLNQMLLQGEQMISDLFLEFNLWNLLWSRVCQSLKPNREIEVDDSGEDNNKSNVPDWVLLSPHGMMLTLQLASRLVTMSTQNCVLLLIKEDNLILDCLSLMLSDDFINALKKTEIDEEDGCQLANEFVNIISQLLCSPFSIDSNDQMMIKTYKYIFLLKNLNFFIHFFSSFSYFN
jgi:fused